jgi:hypothetical protein
MTTCRDFKFDTSSITILAGGLPAIGRIVKNTGRKQYPRSNMPICIADWNVQFY